MSDLMYTQWGYLPNSLWHLKLQMTCPHSESIWNSMAGNLSWVPSSACWLYYLSRTTLSETSITKAAWGQMVLCTLHEKIFSWAHPQLPLLRASFLDGPIVQQRHCQGISPGGWHLHWEVVSHIWKKSGRGTFSQILNWFSGFHWWVWAVCCTRTHWSTSDLTVYCIHYYFVVVLVY